MNISLIITEKQIPRKSTDVTDPDPVTSVIFISKDLQSEYTQIKWENGSHVVRGPILFSPPCHSTVTTQNRLSLIEYIHIWQGVVRMERKTGLKDG
jgi:hypothetical protein